MGGWHRWKFKLQGGSKWSHIGLVVRLGELRASLVGGARGEDAVDIGRRRTRDELNDLKTPRHMMHSAFMMALDVGFYVFVRSVCLS